MNGSACANISSAIGTARWRRSDARSKLTSRCGLTPPALGAVVPAPPGPLRGLAVKNIGLRDLLCDKLGLAIWHADNVAPARVLRACYSPKYARRISGMAASAAGGLFGEEASLGNDVGMIAHRQCQMHVLFDKENGESRFLEPLQGHKK